MQQTLHTYYEPAPYGGTRAHIISLRGDEYLALVAAIDDRAEIIRHQKAERMMAVDSLNLAGKLAMLARHKCELQEINDRIHHIKQLGA